MIRATYDWSSVAASTAVVETVAVASDRDPLDLEPLYWTVDPDALDAIVRPSHPTDGDAMVSFSFAGTDVSVDTDGTVVVRPDGRSDSG